MPRTLKRLLRKARSIRFTLTLWYACSLAVILSVFGWTLYGRVANSTYQEVDKALAADAQHVKDTFEAYWEATRTAAPAGEGNWQSAPSTSLRGEVARGRFETLIKEWSRQTGTLRDPLRTVRMLDQRGVVLTASERFKAWELPVSQFALLSAMDGDPAYRTVHSRHGALRLYTLPVRDDRGVLYIVQSAESFDHVSGSLDRLRWLLLWLIPTIVLLTSVIGWLLANMAMRPVGGMVQHVQRIGDASLQERLFVPATGDEIQRLAETFNAMLERLERAFRRLRQFSAAASHELRTPLTVMKAEIELALRKPRTVEGYQRVLNIHLDALNDLIHIVETLLTLARSERDSAALEHTAVNLSALARQHCDRLRVLAEEVDVFLNVEAKGRVWVQGEPRLLERMIGNLVENALHHTPPGGTVTVVVRQAHHEAHCIVSDTGIGIAKADLPNIFNRFFSRRQRSRGESTGLGLGIVRWIVEAHRGKIHVSSIEGRGSTFSVRLPAARPPKAPVREAEAEEETGVSASKAPARAAR